MSKPDDAAVRIRSALIDEGADLTDLAVRAKAHWGYDAGFLASARAALTIDADVIAAARIYVLERDRAVIYQPGGGE